MRPPSISTEKGETIGELPKVIKLGSADHRLELPQHFRLAVCLAHPGNRTAILDTNRDDTDPAPTRAAHPDLDRCPRPAAVPAPARRPRSGDELRGASGAARIRRV